MGFYDDPYYTAEEREEHKRLYEEARQSAHAQELEQRRNVTSNIRNPKLRDLFLNSTELFEAGKFYQADEILEDNYSLISNEPVVEEYLIKAIKGQFCYGFHPLHRMFERQLEISKHSKPAVGSLVQRHMSTTMRDDGMFRVTPTICALSDRNVPMVRVAKNYEGSWTAFDNGYRGIVTYLDSVPPVDWTHLEIVEVRGRICRAKAVVVDFNQLVRDAVLNFQKLLGVGSPLKKKVQVTIDWRKEC